MDVREESRIDFGYIKQLTLFALILSSFVFLVLTIHSWEDISTLQLSDNDDYMRYYQFTSWLQEGNWYLQPIDNFNPEHGQIIHWSRLPDIPLAVVTLVMKPWVGQQTAEILAMIFVPFIYLVSLCTAVSFFTYRFAGTDAAKLALCMVVLSPLITKFNPGSIDHHNIQLALMAWVIALLPLNKHQAKSKFLCWLHGLLISLSLWIGMENLPIIAITLFAMTILGYGYSIRYLLYCKSICVSSGIFTALFIMLNRPVDEFLIARFDAISFICIVLFFSGYIFCKISILCLLIKNKSIENKFIQYMLLAVISSVPILFILPLLVSGLFIDYPEMLKYYWLSHVTEAKSIARIVSDGGVLDKHNYLIFILPAICSILFFYDRKNLRAIYALFAFLLIFPLFWQVRAIFSVMLIAIPLQAFLCDYLMVKSNGQVRRLIVLLLLMPITPALLLKANLAISSENVSIEIREDEEKNISLNHKVDLIKKNNIKEKLILAPIDYGAPILSLTNNKIISAPYHRNVYGNRKMIEIFTTIDIDFARIEIKNGGFDYILLGKDDSSLILLDNSNSNSFSNLLTNGVAPDWLLLIGESSDGTKLYKIKQEAL